MPHKDGSKSGGGSRLGRENKRKLAFRERLREYCEAKNFDPFLALADLARTPNPIDPNLRFQALKELCQYMEPKLRSVELKGDAEHPLVFASLVKTSLHEALTTAYGIEQARTPRPVPLPAANGTTHGSAPVAPLRPR